MKLAFVMESIVEQDILDKLADILCDRIELMKDKFFEIYQRQEFHSYDRDTREFVQISYVPGGIMKKVIS